MSDYGINRKIVNATKWSSITEILAKIITPLTTMILARILAPEAFGVIATISMITSFADMFTDAGFQKYLVQHEFKSVKEKNNNANVAFWTNLILSIFLWIIISIFNEKIADLVGNPGLGLVIIVACCQLPLTTFSSIQLALFRRDFDFKSLFMVRVVSILIPFFITIPLAFLDFSYWSLIIGSIITQLLNAILLTIKSNWKPTIFFEFRILKKMLSFGTWSLFEAISIWLTAWIDSFIIVYFLNEYFLGVYKTSILMVNSLLALITATTVPILFSALSRLQNNEKEFEALFYKFQRYVSMFVFPLGMGVFLFRDMATQLMLGNQWIEASDVIGIWALTSCITIVLGNYCSEVYRAKGMPKLSFIAQMLHLIMLIPTCIIFGKYGFWPLVYARSLIRIQSIIVHWIIMKIIMKFSIMKTIKNVLPTMLATISMMILGLLLIKISEKVLWSFFVIILCVLFYLFILSLFPKLRREIFSYGIKFISQKFIKSKAG